MTHFWATSGHLLLDREPGGGLVVTDDFLKAYLARPEVLPPEEACPAERALHAKLMAAPQADVAASEIAEIADEDARENWRFLVGWRDRLLAAPTLEAAYARIIREGVAGVPPLFLDQLAHVILRGALDEVDDPYVVRAAECLFRPQRVTFHENTILLADAEIIEGHEADRHASPLLAMLGGPAATSLDILKPANADHYWQRSDGFDMVLDLGGTPSGRAALGEALRHWIRALHGFEVAIVPIETMKDADWRWFVGLDAEATALGNALWQGGALAEDDAARVLALYSLTLPADIPVLPAAKDKPVYLIAAMSPDKILRLKPQNLVAGLPLATRELVN
ncbi:DUF6352 family protein [Bosea sp. PAMC 26642]|uniref:DUF6352 family protein n=1 Tax=Bosea sp. (strain PAMC 26642) TaxID=1792307 RepID=UPI0007703ED3|nr:DUF6352 family protein [Bosea sp. PAMC 26642]AMJ63336.1 hypothetical protein AXW83_26250 [Bosea sp. PAMC 26642]